MADAYTGPLTWLPGVVPAGLTADWQISIGGLTLGAGTSYMVTNWGEFGPDVRNTDAARTLQDGDWLGTDTYAGFKQVIEVTIKQQTSAAAVALHSALLLAWRQPAGSTGTELWIRLPGYPPLRALGRPRRISSNKSGLLRGRIDMTLEFASPLPAWYGATQIYQAAPLSTSGTGRSYDLLYPRVYDLTLSGGQVSFFDNVGTFPALFRWHVSPYTAGHRVTLRNDTTGEYFASNQGGKDADGEGLVVDHYNRMITNNQQAAFVPVLAGSKYFTLEPGVNNALRFEDSESGGGTIFTIYAAPGFLA